MSIRLSKSQRRALIDVARENQRQKAMYPQTGDVVVGPADAERAVDNIKASLTVLQEHGDMTENGWALAARLAEGLAKWAHKNRRRRAAGIRRVS